MGWEQASLGSFVMLIALEVYRNRSTLIRKLSESAEDAKEAFSFKVNLIGFLVCFVITLAAAVALHAYLPVAIFLMILNLTWNLSLTRIEADTSGFGGPPMIPTKQTHSHYGNGATVIISKWLINPNGEGTLTPWLGSFDKATFIGTQVFPNIMAGGYGGNDGYNTGGLSLLPMLKLGDLYNTRRRDIFIACAFGFVGCILITQLLITYALSLWGIGMGAGSGVNIGAMYGPNFNLITSMGPYDDPTNLGLQLTRRRSPEAQLLSADWPMSWVLGAVIVVVLYFVNQRYPRLRLNPIAFVAVSFLCGGWAHYGWVFFPTIIAYIVKVVAIKVGGPTALSEKIVPLALGLIIAGGLSIAVDRLNIIVSLWPPTALPGFN
jgi:hypothetical protein